MDPVRLGTLTNVSEALIVMGRPKVRFDCRTQWQHSDMVLTTEVVMLLAVMMTVMIGLVHVISGQ